MRLLRAGIVILLTAILVWALNRSWGSLPALGRLLDPVNGWAANAEPVDKDFTESFALPGLQQPVSIQYDTCMVPHIRAANNHDLYYTQGYVHAYFRLFQMDLQTRAAAGRVSEVIGEKGIRFDRLQRRKGMVYGAENSLQAMEQDPRTRHMLDAYTAGVNAYIDQIKYRELPLEYKLIGFRPEPWTNLKCALLLKYMADDLTGYTEDIPLTVLRAILPAGEFEKLYPHRQTASTPVIPAGTVFEKPSLTPATVPDSVALWDTLTQADYAQPYEEREGKGSNNWAVSGSRTASGAPILANDPHLGLNLPSLWYQVQLQAPGMNVYGVSLPGAPGIIIGFNEQISWGFTNNYRDVKDFYAIQQVSEDAYMLDGKQVAFTKKIEKIVIKGQPDFIDTVLYTVQGPVLYDHNFHGPNELQKPLALRWMAHRGSNELLSIYLLNRANDYSAFVQAIQQFQCPGQNMIYADKAGNIALWGQGQFINKWQDQGRYIMNGATTATQWGQDIPMAENPHAFNPAQGYLSSANQTVTDSTFPYYYNGYFYEFRAWRINQVLAATRQATIKNMMDLQQDTYSILAANVLPIMLTKLPMQSEAKQQNIKLLSSWDYRLSADSRAATMFQLWWGSLYVAIWKDDLGMVPEVLYPSAERTMQLLQTDDTLSYYDDKNTPEVETLFDIVNRSYEAMLDSVQQLERTVGAEWYKVKNTTLLHLIKVPAFSYSKLKLGGWGNVVNAAKGNHGPSWRMVVQMSKDIEAYGVYPGGQSGNPGSKYYNTFINSWAAGNYYRLLFITPQTPAPANIIKYTWTVSAKR